MKSPLLSGLGSRGSAIGAVYKRRKTLAARKVTPPGHPAPGLRIREEVEAAGDLHWVNMNAIDR
jgi:hypothetical protein